MNYKILLGVVFLSLFCLTAHDTIDHVAISAQAQSMKEAQVKKQQAYETAAKVGAAALCGYLVYYGYSLYAYNNVTVPLNVPETLVKEIKESPALLKEALEHYAASKNSWQNSMFGGFVKFSGSLILQSVILQALQPVYKKIQNYFSSKVSVPVSRSWFLAEQQQGAPEQDGADVHNKKIEIAAELSECVMHIESLEFAYSNQQEDLIKDSAQVILSHILFVKEYETRYQYQRHALQKMYDALVVTIESMVRDARRDIFDQQKVEIFKNQIRELRKLPAYSII